MAPRPSPMYLLIAALSWPLLKGLFRLRARGQDAPAVIVRNVIRHSVILVIATGSYMFSGK